jgi:hypothetical protein
MYLTTYYVAYLAISAALIFWLGRVLHRAGTVLLDEAFHDRPALVAAVSHLLDIGFYLMSIGYVTAWTGTYFPMDTFTMVIQIVSGKVGGFLLMLGCVHLFNLLLLAIFRRRTFVAANPASPTA